VKDFYCPLCAQKHSSDKRKLEVECKCGKKLIVRLTNRVKEVTVTGLTDDDFKDD
jgi:DNA-directed RNA polymerase subunit RPC12/RpoP